MDLEERQSTEHTSQGPGGARVSRDGQRVAVWLWGEHDVATMDLVDTALVEAIAFDTDVVVDLADVGFMDASIFGPLVRGRELLESCGRVLSVRLPTGFSRQVFEMCGLGDLIEDPADTPSDERDAQTALETWVEVPAVSRPTEHPQRPKHPRTYPVRDGSEASRL